MPHTNGPRSGSPPLPQQVCYQDVLRVWREADAVLVLPAPYPEDVGRGSRLNSIARA